MDVVLTSPVKGKMPGETVTVKDSEGRWLRTNGYAKVAGDGDHLLDTSIEAANDPTLAANREKPGDPPGTVANVPSSGNWSEQVVARADIANRTVTGKIQPGRLVAGTDEPAPEPPPEEEPPA